MRRPLLFLAVAVLGALPRAPSTARAEDAPPASRPPLTGVLEDRDGVPLLRLWGTPRERGFAHGWLLAPTIVAGFDRGLADVLGARLDRYDVLFRRLAVSAFRFSPEEDEELAGLLAGIEARLPDAARRTVASLGRPLVLDDLRVLNVFGDLYPLACASVAVWGPRTADGTPSVARNFDFPTLDLVLAHAHVRVVAARDGDALARGWVGVAHPGGIGVLTVMNAEGVFLSIHDVPVRPRPLDLLQGNVPRLVALRRLAEALPAAGAVEAAVELCRSWNTLYGNNLLVATPAVAEGLPAGVLEYDAREEDDRGVDLRTAAPEAPAAACVACTNHHRVRGRGECDRYDLVTGACAGEPRALGVGDLFAIVSRAAFPPPGRVPAPGGFATLHQVVAETGARRLHVRFAGPDRNVRDAPLLDLDVPALLAGPPLPAPR